MTIPIDKLFDLATKFPAGQMFFAVIGFVVVALVTSRWGPLFLKEKTVEELLHGMRLGAGFSVILFVLSFPGTVWGWAQIPFKKRAQAKAKVAERDQSEDSQRERMDKLESVLQQMSKQERSRLRKFLAEDGTILKAQWFKHYDESVALLVRDGVLREINGAKRGLYLSYELDGYVRYILEKSPRVLDEPDPIQ